jgi:hypothetical protein
MTKANKKTIEKFTTATFALALSNKGKAFDKEANQKAIIELCVKYQQPFFYGSAADGLHDSKDTTDAIWVWHKSLIGQRQIMLIPIA